MEVPALRKKDAKEKTKTQKDERTDQISTNKKLLIQGEKGKGAYYMVQTKTPKIPGSNTPRKNRKLKFLSFREEQQGESISGRQEET